MKYLAIILIILLSGCDKKLIESDELKKLKSDYRREMFLECMKAAETQNNGVNSTVESEVSNIVDSCDYYGYYLMHQRY